LPKSCKKRVDKFAGLQVCKSAGKSMPFLADLHTLRTCEPRFAGCKLQIRADAFLADLRTCEPQTFCHFVARRSSSNVLGGPTCRASIRMKPLDHVLPPSTEQAADREKDPAQKADMRSLTGNTQKRH
jgi:hypothetical protein